MSSGPILETRSISKQFAGVTVLDNINLTINTGEILGLVGENGAGKSTLIKIIAGIYSASGGSLELNGQRVEVRDAHAAKQLGIAMVPQEFNLIETLNVFENIFLGNELRKRNRLLDKDAMRQKSRERLDALETSISADAPISTLSVAEKQMVEVSKAMVHESKLLIFDEPTTTLTQHETDILFGVMNRLRSDGVTIIFVSHKLHEVKQLCDRVAVLRDGVLISVDEVADIDEHTMAERMVGRELSAVFPAKSSKAEQDVVLQVRNVTVPGKLRNVSIHLRKGEILGLAGLVGAGRTELAEVIMGLRRKTVGSIALFGEEVLIDNPRTAVNHKLAYLNEDRQGHGIHTSFSVLQNTTLISLKDYVRFFVDGAAERKKTLEYIRVFNTKTASLDTELQFISGGNQQKVYLSKWMDTSPRILILDEPTRGIDINAKSEIYQFIRKLADDGLSIVIISSELEEIIGLCTRTYVLREGSIVGELSDDEITEQEIMFYATGVKAMEAIA